MVRNMKNCETGQSKLPRCQVETKRGSDDSTTTILPAIQYVKKIEILCN